MKIILCLLLLISFGCLTPERKYANRSTTELKLKRHQLIDSISASGNTFNIRFGGMIQPGNPNEDKIKEKDKIERELLRRYQAGDKDAFLPVFR